MRLEKFVDPGDIDPVALTQAVFLDLAEGADPGALVRFLVEQVGLPEDDARLNVGTQNARLEATLHELAYKLENGDDLRGLSNRLVEADWPRELADMVVARTRRELRELARTRGGRDQLLAKSRRRMWAGVAWIAVGLGVICGLWLGASQGEIDYAPSPLILFVITVGPILAGIGLLVRGAVLWFGYRSGTQEPGK